MGTSSPEILLGRCMWIPIKNFSLTSSRKRSLAHFVAVEPAEQSVGSLNVTSDFLLTDLCWRDVRFMKER